MKSFISMLLVWIFIACNLQAMDATISVKITNSPDPDLIYTLPVDGNFFAGTRDTLHSTNGEFNISLPIHTAGFVTLFNRDIPFYLFVMPGQHYSLNIDITKPKDWQINGYEKEGQLLLSKLNLFDDARIEAGHIDSIAANLDDRIRYVNEQVRQKQQQAADCYQQHKISKTFYDALLNSIAVYKVDLLTTNFFFEFREKWEDTIKSSIPFTAEMNQQRQHLFDLWGALYEDITTRQSWVKVPIYNNVLWKFSCYRDILKSGNLVFAAESGEDEYYSKYLGHSMEEYAWANDIYGGFLQNQYEEKWVTQFAAFKVKFPDSRLTVYLAPYINKIVAYNKNKATRKINYLTGYEKINTFDDLAQALKGKITYIDLWATWCNPCRQELSFAPEIHPALEKMGVQSLYISVDFERADQAWKDMVGGLALEGLHMRTSSVLYKDILKNVPHFDGIPRYIIIGKNGEVLEWDAKRPSDKDELIRQLQQYVP